MAKIKHSDNNKCWQVGIETVHSHIAHGTIKWYKHSENSLAVFFKCIHRNSLVVPWLRGCLPLQEMWVRFLVQEDSTHCRATKVVRQSSCSQWPEVCARQPERSPCRGRPTSHERSPCSLQREKATRSNSDPEQPRVKKHVRKIAMQPSNYTQGYLFQSSENHRTHKNCTRIFTAIWFMIAPNWN